jgi:K319-like protein
MATGSVTQIRQVISERGAVFMQKYVLCLVLCAAMLLSGCGAAQVGSQAGTAVSGPEAGTAVSEGANQIGTAISAPEAGTAISEGASQLGTAISAPETGTALSEGANQLGTAVSAPETGTAVAAIGNALTAAEEDVTVKQGEQLVLDASNSVGNITDYKWTIQKAPAGAEAVVGQTIKEGSSGNVSLTPDDYAKYFPKPGTYTVRLTVTDATGATSDDDFSVNVP